MNYNLTIGMKGESSVQVSQENTALAYGSGGVAVYATPAMIGLMENAALTAVDSALPAGMATVGVSLDVKHTAATPVGMTVTATAELIEIRDKRLVFRLAAFDETEQIGEGIHQRYIINLDKFISNAAAKQRL